MGKRGPLPTPTATKEMLGNPGRRPLSKNEVKPKAVAPQCPDWLGDIGQFVWQQVIDAMPAGFIVSVDGLLLAQYCHAWEEFHEAREEIEQNGMTFTTSKGFVGANPAVGIKNKAADRIRKLSANFGFSPSDRVGLEFGVDEEDDDPLVKMYRARAGMN